MPEMLAKDIGMRGVIYSFGEFKCHYDKCFESTTDYLTYCKWFTENLNKIYADHWLDQEYKKTEPHLLHVTYDHNDTTINYRLEDAENALGLVVLILIAAYSHARSKGGKNVVPCLEQFEEIWDKSSDKLFSTLIKGYKKQCTVIVKLNGVLTQGTPEFKKEVNKDAEKKTNAHIAKFRKVIDNVLLSE